MAEDIDSILGRVLAEPEQASTAAPDVDEVLNRVLAEPKQSPAPPPNAEPDVDAVLDRILAEPAPAPSPQKQAFQRGLRDRAKPLFRREPEAGLPTAAIETETAPVETVTPPAVPEPGGAAPQPTGFGESVGRKLLKGAASTVGGALRTASELDITLQGNKMLQDAARKFGVPESAIKLAEATSPFAFTKAVSKFAAPKLREFAKAIQPNVNGGEEIWSNVVDAYKTRDPQKALLAGRNLVFGLAENLPQIALLAAAGPAAGSSVLGASAAGNKLDELVEANPDINPVLARLNAAATGALEAVTERFGSSKIVNRVIKKQVFTQGFKQGLKEILKDAGIEATEETLAQIGGNALDILTSKATGGKTRAPGLFDGVADAATIGAFMGGGIGAVGVATQDRGAAPPVDPTVEPTPEAPVVDTPIEPGATPEQIFGRGQEIGAAMAAPPAEFRQTVVEQGQEDFDPDVRRHAQQVMRNFPETREGVSAMDIAIDHLSDADAVAQARNMIAQDEAGMRERIKSVGNDPLLVTAAEVMYQDKINAGEVDGALDILNDYLPQTTSVAQSLQKMGLLGRLTPEGMVRYAQRQLINTGEKLGRDLKLTGDEAQQILDFQRAAQEAKEAGDGREHDKNIARSLAIVADKVPASMWKKVSMVQTLAQLLNVKTVGRNIVGNSLFAGLDNVSKSFATTIDSLASTMTGQRTTTLPSVKRQLRGFKQGFKESVEEISEGIDTQPQQTTKFDLPRGKVFAGKFMRGLEKTLGYALRATDRAAFQAEFNDSLARQMQAAGVETATTEMIDNAMYDGLYVTFQDESVAARTFSGLKNLLNNITPFTKGEFGLGDLVLKYPKTPANLLQRGIDYSPAGLLRGIFQFAQPIFGKPLNQYRASLNLSRGIVGTGFMLATALLAKLGIIAGAGERDRDVEELEREQGAGRYRVNASALKRFIMSGFNKDVVKRQDGDVMMTYDWAQPLSIPAGAAATLGEASLRQKFNAGDVAGSVALGLSEGTRTLAEQPLLTGVRRFAGGEDIMASSLRILEEAPASFVPTILGQMALYAEPTIKDPRDRKTWNAMFKRVAKKVPGLNQFVPDRVNSSGRPVRIKNPSLFSLFVSPAIVTKFESRPGAQLVTDIFNRGLERRQFPRVVKDRMTLNGQPFLLTPEERNQLQEAMGTETMERLDKLAASPSAWTQSPERTAEMIDRDILTPISRRAKTELFNQIGLEEIKRRVAELGGKPEKVRPPSTRTRRRRRRTRQR